MGVCTGFFDGGSRGNPGPAAAGAVLLDETGEVLFEEGRFLGKRTNNEAEYEALILLLEEAARRHLAEVVVRGDSRLVISQMRGEWKIREPHLQELAGRARSVARGKLRFDWIPREQNARADALVNGVLDREAREGSAKKPSPPSEVPSKGAPSQGIPEEGGEGRPLTLRRISQGLVLVVSDEEYAVDLVHQSCTCPGFRFRGECRHLRAVLAAERTSPIPGS